MEIRGDAGMRTRWDVRTPGCRDTAAGQREAVRARPGPCTYSAARSTPGKRVTAKGAVLWDGSSPRLSSHSSFPTTGASLNPWPAGRRGWLGGVRPPPWAQPALGCWGGGRAGCPRLPEKPAPMMMLLNSGCLSRMKSSSGVFWGSHGVRVWGPGSSPGPEVEGGRHGKVHLGVEEGLGPQTPGSCSSEGGSHRVEAGLHHGRPGLQPGQVAADEAAQEGDVGVGGTQGDPVPLLRVSGAAVVVAHLGGAAGQGGPAEGCPHCHRAPLTLTSPGYSRAGSP